MSTLGEKIRIERQKKGMSQIELAKTADVYQKNISRYENGTTDPSATALKKIANALEITADYLLNDTDQKVEIRDKDLLLRFQEIQDMTGKTKETVITLLDLVIRDFKAKQAYS
jgi:transcriptional regulator with XRE-family HTH domain